QRRIEPAPRPAVITEASSMQTYLFIGGNQDGLSVPLQSDPESVQLPAGVTGKETYIRDTLSVGDASVAIFRHEGLTSEQVLELLLRHYKAWAVNRPGGRR